MYIIQKCLYLLSVFGLALATTAGLSGCRDKVEQPQTDDNVYSAAYVCELSIDKPDRALAILDSAEQLDRMSDFDINRLRAIVYHNGLSDNIKSLEYALKAYKSPSARRNTRNFVRLLEIIADQYYLNGDYPQSIKFCTEGIKLAQDSMIKGSEAGLSFDLGRNLLILGRQDEGFRYYRQSVDILDGESRKDPTWETADNYTYSLAILIGSLRNEGRYDEAIALMPRYNDAVKRLETKPDIPESLVDMRRASGYGMAAVLHAIMGNKETAREQYKQLLATDYAKTPDAGQLTIPYLYQVGEYREALQALQEEKKYWQANTDTVSYSYIQNHLESELAVYEKLGDLHSANRVMHTIQTLNDSLRNRDRNLRALELAEIHKTDEQALEIERQSASIVIQNIIIAAGVILLLAGIILMIRMLLYNRAIRNKNQSMVNTIDELIGYKDKLYEQESELIALRRQLQAKTSVSEASVVQETPNGTAEAGNDTDTPNDFDRILFQRMNHEILSQRLFLNPDLSKKQLVEQFRIPSNKFAQIFKDYAGCSFTQYINNCRLEHAVRLMRDNPQWSLKAIATEAAMSSSSFYEQFRKKFGMSPTDFKAN